MSNCNFLCNNYSLRLQWTQEMFSLGTGCNKDALCPHTTLFPLFSKTRGPKEEPGWKTTEKHQWIESRCQKCLFVWNHFVIKISWPFSFKFIHCIRLVAWIWDCQQLNGVYTKAFTQNSFNNVHLITLLHAFMTGLPGRLIIMAWLHYYLEALDLF